MMMISSILLPAAKLAEWILAEVVKICFASENHKDFVQAFRIPSMCGFCAESTRKLAQNWIHRHFLGWDAKGWTLQFDPGAHTMGDFSGFLSQRYHLFHVSSISPPDQMFHGPKIPIPKLTREIHRNKYKSNRIKCYAMKNNGFIWYTFKIE